MAQKPFPVIAFMKQVATQLLVIAEMPLSARKKYFGVVSRESTKETHLQFKEQIINQTLS